MIAVAHPVAPPEPFYFLGSVFRNHPPFLVKLVRLKHRNYMEILNDTK